MGVVRLARVTSIGLVMFLVASLLVVVGAASAQLATATGDATCNGIVDAGDALADVRNAVGLFAAGDCADADVSGDGFVNSLDALLVAQQVADANGTYTVNIVGSYPHDPMAFTQGLEFVDGDLIESTGLFGQSDLRRVDPVTGTVIAQVGTPDNLFAEGVTRVGDQLIQLTWKAERAFVWNTESLELEDEFAYSGQGWGLCFDGAELVMSDGSDRLTFRDPATFAALRTVPVLNNGISEQRLNELECAGGAVWANVWLTDRIVGIDPATGVVFATVDASDLSDAQPVGSDVLNGVAFDAGAGTFWVTGKRWSTMYEVRFVPLADQD